MSQTASNIASAIGRWVGGIIAHLVALILTPIINRVSQRIHTPHPLEARVDDLIGDVRGLRDLYNHLMEVLETRPEPAPQRVTIRLVHVPRARRRRSRGPADNTGQFPG